MWFAFSCSAVFHYCVCFRVFIMRAGRTRGYIRVFFFPLSLSLHFLVWDCGGGVDWCLLFGGFRKVQARSSWFGYKTDIYRFLSPFFSHSVWLSSLLYWFILG